MDELTCFVLDLFSTPFQNILLVVGRYAEWRMQTITRITTSIHILIVIICNSKWLISINPWLVKYCHHCPPLNSRTGPNERCRYPRVMRCYRTNENARSIDSGSTWAAKEKNAPSANTEDSALLYNRCFRPSYAVRALDIRDLTPIVVLRRYVEQSIIVSYSFSSPGLKLGNANL